jgi:hypothetical protein
VRTDAADMLKRRLKQAGLPAHYSPHSFRATGITNFLEDDGTLEAAQRIAGHADSRTTKLCDRRGQKVLLDIWRGFATESVVGIHVDLPLLTYLSCIYLITASECHEPSQRTQTEFIVKGTRGIFTALHGLVDAKHIGAVSEVAKRGVQQFGN